MREAVIASMDCDWYSVAAGLAGPVPGGRPIWYQKHKPHHMVGPLAPDDLCGVTHAFLVRDPARMAASYVAKRETVTADDLGVAAQRGFFEREASTGFGGAEPLVGDLPAGLAAVAGACRADYGALAEYRLNAA